MSILSGLWREQYFIKRVLKSAEFVEAQHVFNLEALINEQGQGKDRYFFNITEPDCLGIDFNFQITHSAGHYRLGQLSGGLGVADRREKRYFRFL
jgi:hypothetical protein